MATTILTNWTIYYAEDTGGDKQIKWTGTTSTNTVNELYSAIADLFSIDAQNGSDDTIPIKAITPTLYEIGAFDSGDLEPWFIDPESIKHLTGGGIDTSGWTRTTGADIGIIKLPYTVGGGSDFIDSDIGKHVDLSANDGTLLHYNSTDLECWIRPDTNAAVDDFDDAGTLSVASGTGSVTIGATTNTTGEMIWSNVFSLGTIEDNTTIHIAQSNSAISNTEDSGSGSWWSDGHLDVLILTTNQDTLTDRGLLTLYTRQYSKRYSYYITDASGGGRIPIPLSTSDDPNNESGYRTFTGSAGAGTFTVGNAIYVGASWAAATAKGILTAVGGTVADPIVTYYLIGDLTDMSSTVYEYDFVSDPRTTYCTTGTPADTGPASQSLTIAFGLDESLDVDGDTSNEDYSVIINLTSSITLATMNERFKYITRRGETTITLDGIEGQQYIGIDYRIDYNASGLTGTIADGSTVTQTLADGTTATAEVVAHDTTDEYMMLRDTRGILEYGTGTGNIEIDGSNYVTMTTGTTEIIAPSLEHPFGIFAGGKFFGARGVAVKLPPSADANNYVLVDNGGTTRTPPLTVPVEISGVIQGTQCYIADSTPTEYLNESATTPESGDEYKADSTHEYSSDISVTVRAREMGYLPFETAGTIGDTGLSVTAVWLVDPNWKLVVSEENISFTNPTTITRTNATFITEGWINTMSQVTVEGSAANDGTYTISAVAASALTIFGDTVSTAGAASDIILTFTRRDKTW